jgi:putative tricarboxylic transport membrane protein
MDVFHSIGLGLSIILTPSNLFFCFVGCFVGTLVGVLPGIGSTGAVALLLSFTFKMPAVTSIIMLAGIFYGAMYGGSTTSILVNIPGEAASVVTCIDGYQMARQGRAGRALGIAAIGSWVAGTGGVVLLMILAPPLARFALRFGPPEFFALIFFALTLVAYLSPTSMIKSFLMVATGMLISTVGIDTDSGLQRFTFGVKELYDGVGLIPIIMGLFGVGEILVNLEETLKRSIFKTQIGGLLPDKKDLKDSAIPIIRGSLLGFFIGVLPGCGASICSFVSYSVEKRFSKHPEKFGKGAIEGVAGPESANNSACAGAFIPLLTFGIPTTPTMALLLGAFLIHNVIPGPLLIQNNPDVFWGVVLSMYVGNLMLLILNLPLISIWVKLLRVPYAILFPLILFLCLIGVYANNGSLFDMNVMIIFGLIGYLMRKTGFDAAPLIFAYMLCPLLEEAFRRALLISSGDLFIFFKRPISAILLSLTFLFIISSIFSSKKRRRLAEKLGEE